MENKEEELKEERLVKRLKISFPDLLDFNNVLKDLRTFWKEQGRKEAIEEEIKFLTYLEDEAEDIWDDINDRKENRR